MDRTTFLRELEVLLEVEPGILNGRENLDELEAWNSLAIMSFIAFADERLGVSLSPKKIMACKTCEGLFDLTAAETEQER